MGHGHGHAPARPAADRPRWLAGLDTFLGFLIEIPAAILVLTEIVVLLAGVIGRYVFHSPIIWSDELASILFLWLAMLGAVVAFRRAEHMRMTAVVGMLSPPMRAFLDVVAVAAALAFLFMTIMPAIEFAEEEA
ncbi:MAG: TRAP transporter small permease subunit, partial [Hyphomicrobiaceae bacterium]